MIAGCDALQGSATAHCLPPPTAAHLDAPLDPGRIHGGIDCPRGLPAAAAAVAGERGHADLHTPVDAAVQGWLSTGKDTADAVAPFPCFSAQPGTKQLQARGPKAWLLLPTSRSSAAVTPGRNSAPPVSPPQIPLVLSGSVPALIWA